MATLLIFKLRCLLPQEAVEGRTAHNIGRNRANGMASNKWKPWKLCVWCIWYHSTLFCSSHYPRGRWRTWRQLAEQQQQKLYIKNIYIIPQFKMERGQWEVKGADAQTRVDLYLTIPSSGLLSLLLPTSSFGTSPNKSYCLFMNE